MKFGLWIFFAALCVVNVFCWITIEPTEVTAPVLKRLGYTCMPKQYKVGPMKKGQTKGLSDICGRAVCQDKGFVEYSGCFIPPDMPGCVIIPGEPDKPYPSCCESSKC